MALDLQEFLRCADDHRLISRGTTDLFDLGSQGAFHVFSLRNGFGHVDERDHKAAVLRVRVRVAG